MCLVIEEQALIATWAQRPLKPLTEPFERLFREHSEFIFRTAYRITGCSEDAEDVVQTLFVQLMRRELPAEFLKNSKAYLYRSAVNISLNLIRSRKRNQCVEDPSELEDASTTEETRGQREIRQRLRIAMAELHPKAAEILLLRHVHGYTDAEIAKLLGTSRGTVAVSLFRSRRRLRDSIRKMGDDNETT